MPTIGLTTFVDFIAASGLKRVKVVEQSRREDNLPYNVMRDFYKRLRESTVSFANGNMNLEEFQTFIEELSDQKKRTNFPEAIQGFEDFWVDSGFQNLASPRGSYARGQLSVTINPELNIRGNGGQTAVKCWFKKEPVPRTRLNYILAAMRLGLNAFDGDVAILDVRRATLHQISNVDRNLEILLRGEADGFMSMWDAFAE